MTEEDDNEEGVVMDSSDVLTQEIATLNEYTHKKNEGSLTLEICGPESLSEKVTAHVNLDGPDGEQLRCAFWDDCETDFAKLSHPSFGNTFSCKCNSQLSLTENL